MVSTAALTRANAERWKVAKMTRPAAFLHVAERLAKNKGRYVEVERRTSVPWFVVAVIHEREASGRWDANIAQGDRWDRVSTHVPKGRGPFKSWADAACDALTNCAPYAARWSDWSAGGTLTLLERYNGLGYAAKGLPSPYIWSGTDQYRSGKYVADHVFDPNAVDRQLGCAGLLLFMREEDASIRFAGEGGAKKTPPAAQRRPQIRRHVASAVPIAAAVVAASQTHSWPIAAAVIFGGVAAAVVLYLILRKKG